MTRGTFRKIGLQIGAPFSKVRRIFNKQATDYARELLKEIVNEIVPEEHILEHILRNPGDAWAYCCGAAYKAFASLVKEKADKRELKLENNRFNVTYEEVKSAIPPETKERIVRELKERG